MSPGHEVHGGRGPISVAGISGAVVLAALVHQLLTPVNAEMGWGFRGFVLAVALPYTTVGDAIQPSSVSLWMITPGGDAP